MHTQLRIRAPHLAMSPLSWFKMRTRMRIGLPATTVEEQSSRMCAASNFGAHIFSSHLQSATRISEPPEDTGRKGHQELAGGAFALAGRAGIEHGRRGIEGSQAWAKGHGRRGTRHGGIERAWASKGYGHGQRGMLHQGMAKGASGMIAKADALTLVLKLGKETSAEAQAEASTPTPPDYPIASPSPHPHEA